MKDRRSARGPISFPRKPGPGTRKVQDLFRFEPRLPGLCGGLGVGLHCRVRVLSRGYY